MLNFARRRLRDGVLLLHEDLDLALRCLRVAVHVVGEVGDTERPGKEESHRNSTTRDASSWGASPPALSPKGT